MLVPDYMKRKGEWDAGTERVSELQRARERESVRARMYAYERERDKERECSENARKLQLHAINVH